MKKRFFSLAILILTLSAIIFSSLGCELDDAVDNVLENSETDVGRVLVSGTSYLIVYDDGSFLVMNYASDNESVFSGLTDGDKIEIVRNPEIMESYPAQCYVKKCKKLEDGELSDVSPIAIERLSELGWIKSN